MNSNKGQDRLIYPKLPMHLDKRRKLSSEDIAEMKEWRDRGKSYRWIGEAFGVSATTAHYHTDEAYARKLNAKRYASIKKRKEEDPEFARKHREQSIKSYIEGFQKYPERAVYKNKVTYKWKKKRYHSDPQFREKTLSQAREAYRRKAGTL